jgi:hypothetical protein
MADPNHELCHHTDGTTGKALEKYKDAATIDPNLAAAHLHCGRVFLLLDNAAAAYPRLYGALSSLAANAP